MEAIIRHSGRQFRVQKGSKIEVDQHALEPGSQIEFGEVLYIGREGSAVSVGKPLIAGARVVGKVLGESRGPKLIAATFRRRKNSRRRVGHRQRYTKVVIESIEA
ncbi:MAG TPA: 50S ribosomal protein L21 [Planctomycetota bacterium]|jgi:large subunit ribosomal protein L21|nr:50S ribosomal protein L21 [Planctomycetota bacterium]